MQRRTLADRYHILTKLAEGGMGVTYRAWDDKEQRPVVIKEPKRPRDDPDGKRLAEVVARFRREIQAMESVRGRAAVVPVIDSGEDDELPFIVMRLLPGGSLADRRKAGTDSPYRPLPTTQLRSWLPVVASALDHIHSLGMIHRDVKPSNIFFDAFELAYLGDFGIAKPVDPSGAKTGETVTATHTAIGTPEYMAPELTRQGERLGGAIDQYAIAVTVYEIISGRRPFTGLAGDHIIVEHAIKPVPPLDGKLPTSLRIAVERGLAKKPEDRFSNCTGFAEAVLVDIPILRDENSVARFLCLNQKCRKLLKIPVTEAGKRGSCPGCHALVEIAGDLSALWLQSEVESIRPKNDFFPSGSFFEHFEFGQWSRNASELGEVDSDVTDGSAKKNTSSVRQFVSSCVIPLLETLGPIVLAVCVMLAGVMVAVWITSSQENPPTSPPKNPDQNDVTPDDQVPEPDSDTIQGLWSWEVDGQSHDDIEFLPDGGIKLNNQIKDNRWWKIEECFDRSIYVAYWPDGPFVDVLELKDRHTLGGKNNCGYTIVGKRKELTVQNPEPGPP